MNNYSFRKATLADTEMVWTILQKAIKRRKDEGSNQWQDGYPNPEIIALDIQKNAGYVLILNNTIIGYCAILINDEPEYENIIGRWITNADFVVFHRVAIAEEYLGKGMAKILFNYIEEFAKSHAIESIKADTNYDNLAMIHLFEKSGYVYCGEVYFRGSPRKAFEKIVK
jgi:GNAT superfamily N-acetyltransferase